jgi:thiol-disulfide isomerase/thioredoxin
MKNKAANFITVLQAEHIKKRGTGFYWTSAILGILSPLLYATVLIIQDSEEIKNGIPYNHYLLFIENAVGPFAFFFFPLLIIITISRITQLDHKNGGWQLMETQPSEKFSIYFSKFTTVLIANFISILSFMVISVLAAWILTYMLTIPKMAIYEIPFMDIGWMAMRLFVASLLVTAFQFVICVLIPSFIWSIIIGFFGLLLTLFLKPFGLIPVWYPYEILSKVASNAKGSDVGHWLTFTEYIGILASIMVLYIGYQWYKHKRFATAFFGKITRAVSLLFVIAVLGGVAYWALQPNVMPDSDKTVLAGKIDSKLKFRNIYLIDYVINDTVAVIPVKDNMFNYHFEKPVVNDYYSLNIDGKFQKPFYFGSNDSIYTEIKIYAPQEEYKFRGTRVAENQMATQVDFDWSRLEYYLQENIDLDKPDKIAGMVYDEWKDAYSKPNKFRTVDNYIPKADFRLRTSKLATVKYLNLWNGYLKKRAALYPNEKTIESENIKEIRKSLSLTDESLLSTPDYFNFVRSELLAKNKDDKDDNTKALLAITAMKNGPFKDKMLFWQLKKSVEETAGTEERNALLANYNNAFSNPKYSKSITAINKMVESLGKGKEAPAFDAASVDQKRHSLAGFKGRFVIIDVWATWCGPCREQSPIFEKFAIKYKKENIAFVALSTDQDIEKWYVDAKSKSKSVLQLHLNDPDKFGKEYGVESIPRFILIDPDGKFVNARLPFPSDGTFEILLRKELGLPEEK